MLRSPVDDAADVLLLVQRSYLNAPGRTERLSECVAGRLNQGTNFALVMQYLCSLAVEWRRSRAACALAL